MSRSGPPHYHQGSTNLCHCNYSEVYHHTAAPYVYPTGPIAQAPARPRPVAGHPSEYGPAVRRVPKPKPINKIAKSRDMKFDEDSWQWYFETAEAPGVRWLETVRHIDDLPQAKDPDFHAMINEYYLCGHVIDMPDQDRLPVMPGGPGKTWRYKRAAPPAPGKEDNSPDTPPPPTPQKPPRYEAYVEPIYHHRQPAAPVYASGSAHPVSARIPSGVHRADAYRMYSNAPPQEFPRAIQEVYPPPGSGGRTLGPLPGAPGPRRYVDATAHQRYYDHRLAGPEPDDDYDEDSYDDEEEDEDDYDGRTNITASASAYEDARSRAYIPPPSPKSRKRAQKLRDRGYRVVNPHNNVELEELEAQARAEERALRVKNHGRSASAPTLPTGVPVPGKIEIHRLLQTRTTLGLSRMPDLVFDLRYDPRHAFDRTAIGSDENDYWAGGAKQGNQRGEIDLTTAPAFQPGQQFVRLVIRHPFNGRGGDWVEDIDDAQYMTVMDVLKVLSEMVHRNIDQNLDWDPLSESDKSFVYEAYLNRPYPDEEATGRRLHLFCEKYMFGGIEQLPPNARATTAEGPSFLVKLIKNSKHKSYSKLVGFQLPSKGRRGYGRATSGMTYPYLTDDSTSSRRAEG